MPVVVNVPDASVNPPVNETARWYCASTVACPRAISTRDRDGGTAWQVKNYTRVYRHNTIQRGEHATEHM